MIREDIKRYLESKNLKFWTLSTLNAKRLELYTIFNEIESRRDVIVKTYKISIYVDHGSYTGNSSFSIPTSASLEEVKKSIDQAIEKAKMIKNKRYEIEQEEIEYKTENYELNYNDMNQMIEQQKEALSNERDIKLSSSEYFINSHNIDFCNSANNSYSLTDSNLSVDLVLLAGKNMEVESQTLRNAKSLESLNMKDIISDYSKMAIDSLDAELPKSGKYRVVFTGEILEEFFSFFVMHSLGSTTYNNFSLFKKGENVFDLGNGDNLNISSNPHLKYGMSSKYDDLGFPLKPFDIIKDSKLESIIASYKYAQYLNLPFTGQLSNFVLKPGTKSYKELVEQEDTLLISRVSCFSPKEMTGDFSSEIRSAYLYKNGKHISLKGGSFSGNLRELMKSLQLSKETIYYNTYYGPKAIVLEGVDIAG